MKCPVCQAKLMPVDGEMFCLQCGEATAVNPAVDMTGPVLEETTDPLLQRAIVDMSHDGVHFRLPVAAAPKPVPLNSFTTMRQALAPPRPAVAPAVAVRLVPVAPVVSNLALAGAGGPPLAAPVLNVPARAAPVEAPITIKMGAGSINLLPAVVPRARPAWHWPQLSLAWVAGTAVFAAFVGLNLACSTYYAARVFPGVHVGNVDVGGLPNSQVEARLKAGLTQPKLAVTVGAASYALPTENFGGPDLAQAARNAQLVGHTTPLPVAGWLEAWFSSAVVVHYVVNNTTLTAAVNNLAAQLDHKASDAVPMVVNGQAFVVTEKTGEQLDIAKAKAAVEAAFGTKTSISLSTDQLNPLVTSSGYKSDVEQAQILLGLSLKLTQKASSYQPSAAQIGGWLVFSGPGKGVSVNQAQVAAFINGIPGKFDRLAAYNVLVGAVEAGQNLNYAVSAKKVTATPKPADTAAALPLAAYRYCVQVGAGSGAQLLATQAGASLSGAAGWGVSGRLGFSKVNAGCNFTLKLVAAKDMASVDSLCSNKNSCAAGNVLAFSETTWARAPKGWTGTQAAYQQELVNQEVGHWLGFDHASCTTNSAAAVPILQQPTLVLAGCSPNWYEIPAEIQGTKALEDL